MPYVFLLYIVAFLDRVNVGYAALQMAGDLGFSAEVFGFGAGIFFFGYVILEIPGSVIVERWSARKWIARIMISWGILATWMGFIRGASEFYWLRFFLGAAEAGFFPGIIAVAACQRRSPVRSDDAPNASIPPSPARCGIIATIVTFRSLQPDAPLRIVGSQMFRP